jgi:F-type H+-transporting ATPase subunit b
MIDMTTRAIRVVVFAVLALTLSVGLPARVAFANEEHAEAAHGEAAAAHGEGHEGGAPSIDLKTLGLQLLNFGVLLFILIKFGGGAINKSLAARHNQLKADLATAAELKATAEAKLAKQEARLAALETEIADMRKGLHAEAEAEKVRLIAAAEERARRIKEETAFLVEQQMREAESRLRRESADAALKTAEEILRRAVGPADRQRMLDTFVADVERSGNTAAPRAGGEA